MRVGELTDSERETLVLLAYNGMSISRVAEEIHYSRQTVYDRLRSIKAKTGVDPCDFWGLHELLCAIRNERKGSCDEERTD